jgi:hypothetical protein
MTRAGTVKHVAPALAVLVASAAAPGAARAQDRELDGLPDPVDAFPCDGAAVGQSYQPEGGHHENSEEPEGPEDDGGAIGRSEVCNPLAELSEQDLERAAGGLDPQPLPPRTSFGTNPWNFARGAGNRSGR